MATPKTELKHPNPVASINHPSGSAISITNVNQKDKTSGKGGNIQIASVADLKLVSKGKTTLYTDKEMQFLAKGVVSVADVIVSHGKSKIAFANGNRSEESTILMQAPLMQITNGLGNITINKTAGTIVASWGSMGLIISATVAKFFNGSSSNPSSYMGCNSNGSVSITSGGNSISCSTSGVNIVSPTCNLNGSPIINQESLFF